MLKRICYYLKRIKNLGLQQSGSRAYAHLTTQWWRQYWRMRTEYNFLPAVKIDADTELLGNTVHLTYFFANALYHKSIPTSITARASEICAGVGSVFGTSVDLNDPLVWHRDPRVSLSCPWYNPSQPTFALSLKPCTGINEQADIKFPWELSRLQHLTTLGFAYQETTDATKKILYAQTMVQQITAWQNANPFMKGVNWANTMEVAIRATNLIYLFHFFKNEATIPDHFWHTFVTLLKQHEWYIETQWETSATPNNHYLADLVGYLHLLLFFSASPQKIKACLMRCKHAFEHQVLGDGWAYEGSTAYHQLDTEMILHLLLIAEYCGSPHFSQIKLLYEKMAAARASMITSAQELITIGDDDSGKFVTGLSLDVHVPQNHLYSYPEAGFTVIQRNRLHLTMRHATYHNSFPSGHYHRDDLSITLAVDGNQILIDPGSFVYTGNPRMRRQFRSWESHNTVFCVDELGDQDELFQLTKHESSALPRIVISKNLVEIVSERSLYCSPGTGKRRLSIAENKMSVDDEIVHQTQHQATQTLIFAPDVTLTKKDKIWLISHPSGISGTLTSPHEWKLENWLTATGYGVIAPCKRLRTISEKDRFNVLNFCIDFS